MRDSSSTPPTDEARVTGGFDNQTEACRHCPTPDVHPKRIGGVLAYPNPDACCSRNAFEDDAHSRTCPNWTDEARPSRYILAPDHGDEARAGEPRQPAFLIVSPDKGAIWQVAIPWDQIEATIEAHGFKLVLADKEDEVDR